MRLYQRQQVVGDAATGWGGGQQRGRLFQVAFAEDRKDLEVLLQELVSKFPVC